MDTRNRGRGEVDPAVHAARLVVGLYGDPAVAWSIVLRLGLADPADALQVQARWEEMCSEFPGLGRAGVVARSARTDAADLALPFADEQYADHDPLMRVGLGADGRYLLVAAHHGAVDGLGLLGAAGRLVGLDLRSSARGVPSDADASNFWIASLRRLSEALLHPPQRVRSRRARRGGGDLLVSRTVPAGRGGSAALLLAAARSVRDWNASGPRSARRRPLVVGMGLSRRPGSPMPTPDRDTAYVRLDAGNLADLDGAREVLEATRPEPAFPQTDGFGIGPLVTKVLGNRLGSTLLVSNLGMVSGDGLETIEFWPVPAGPAGVALGLASTRFASTVTVRARRPWFDQRAAEEVADLVTSHFEASASGARPQ